jgi:hypothetical protein
VRRLLAVLTGVLALALLSPVASPSVAAPIGTPVPRAEADYRFRDTLASSVAGAPVLRNLTGIGTNSFATETVDGRQRRVLRFAQGNGLRLGDATRLVARNKYSIAVRFRFDDVDGYRRLISFRPNSSDWSDTGLYVDDGDLVWYDRRHPDLDVVGEDTWVTVTLTRSANAVVRGYVGPDQVFSFNDFNSRAVIDANRIIRFFRDDADEESSGAVTRIRIWDEVLTPDQVAHLSAV